MDLKKKFVYGNAEKFAQNCNSPKYSTSDAQH